MRQLHVSSSLLTFLDELEFTEAALAAEPDAASFAPAFEERIGEWEGLFRVERTSRRAVTRATAVVSVRNAQIDGGTMRLGAISRANDPSGALLKRLFGQTAPSRFIAQSLRKQCERTRDVLVPELDKLDAAHPSRALRAVLAASAEAALSALDARNEARGARQITANDVDDWKIGVNKLRITTYAELLKIAAAKGYAKSWAEAFFRTDSDAKVEAGSEDDDAPEPTPAS